MLVFRLLYTFFLLSLDAYDDVRLNDIRFSTDYDCAHSAGSLRIVGNIAAPGSFTVQATLATNGAAIKESELPVEEFNSCGIVLDNLDVDAWWPNQQGVQQLYDVKVSVLDGACIVHDELIQRLGFRRVEWMECEGSPKGADPWICVINGRPVFLQGVNWTPIRPNYADVMYEDYAKRILAYKDMGINILRVWGGASKEKREFYDLCDEQGLLIWQEFPVSSSGGDCYPPEAPGFISEMSDIARHYIRSLRHHPSLIVWCGGNELIFDRENRPVDMTHPLLYRLNETVEMEDPSRRFLATSPSGPSVWCTAQNVGKGVHWDVHGPWKMAHINAVTLAEWSNYWASDDSLFRSEVGAPGASSLDLTAKYAGDLEPTPINALNPLWRRPIAWWVEADDFVLEFGREPQDLAEYVSWSQGRQAKALGIAAKSCKDRFPSCGGIIIWMGHDCFPCAANTSVLDFNGDPKPAARALAAIFTTPSSWP